MRAAWEIAKREVADNLATWKIPLTFLLATVLLVTGVLSLAVAHEQGRETYQLVEDEYAAQGRENSAEALAHRFLGAPNPLALVVGGPGEAARAAFATPPAVSNSSANVREAPTLLRFPPTDLGTLGVGVLTLLAILLSHDTIAGEKERGTLKVLLVNPLSRRHVLAGKYLGAMISLLAPVGAALLVAWLALLATGVRFAPGDYARLLLVLGFLVLLVSAFVLLGILASALTHRTSVAILALSLVWMILAVGAGSVATFAASVQSEARGVDEVVAELRIMHRDFDERQERLDGAIRALEEKNATQGTLAPEDEARLAGLRAERTRLAGERLAAQDGLLAAYFRSTELDYRRAERYAALSPAEGFRSLAQALARTDHEALRLRLDEFSTYLREIELQRADRDARGLPGTQPPPFRHAPVQVESDLARASPFALSLLAQNAALALVAAAAFARYDVR